MSTASFPIIHLEVSGMKHAICVALSQYQIDVDKYIQAELDRICSPENLSKIISDITSKSINDAIEDEIRTFFKYGNGRKAIKEAVLSKLDEERKYRGSV